MASTEQTSQSPTQPVPSTVVGLVDASQVVDTSSKDGSKLDPKPGVDSSKVQAPVVSQPGVTELKADGPKTNPVSVSATSVQGTASKPVPTPATAAAVSTPKPTVATPIPKPEELIDGLPKPKPFTTLKPLEDPTAPSASSSPLEKPTVPTLTKEEWVKTNQRPEKISIQEWHEVYEHCGLLRGFHTKAPDVNGLSMAGQVFALPDKPTYINPNASDIFFEELKSSAYQGIVSQGFRQEDLDAALGASFESFSVGVSASGGSSTTKIDKTSTSSEEHILVALNDVSMATVSLTPSQLVLTKECRDAAQAVLDKKSFESVTAFNERFGVLFVTEVELGGRLFSSARFASTNKSAKHQLEDKFRSSFQASFTIPLALSTKAGISTEKQDGSATTDTNQSSQDVRTWRHIGGSFLASTNPKVWLESLLQPQYWSVTKRRGLKRVATLVSRYPGLEDFETVCDALLLQGRPRPLWIDVVPFELPNIAETEDKPKPLPLRGLRIGQGIDSTSGDLKQPFALALIPQQVGLPEKVEWGVYANLPALTDILAKSFQREKADFNLDYVPLYLGNIRVSEPPISEQFTVLTQWFSGGTSTTPNAAFPFDLAHLAEDAIKLDTRAFKDAYGDHFISAFEQRSVAIVVWSVTCPNAETKERLLSSCKGRLSQAVTLEEGSLFMENLLKDEHSTSGEAWFYASSAAAKSMSVQGPVGFAKASGLLQQHGKDKQTIYTRVRFEPYIRSHDSTQVAEEYRDQWTQAWKLLYLTRNLAVATSRFDTTLSTTSNGLIDGLEKRLLASQIDILRGQQKTADLLKEITDIRRQLQLRFDQVVDANNVAKKQAEEARKKDLTNRCIDMWFKASQGAECSTWAGSEKLKDHALVKYGHLPWLGCRTGAAIRIGWTTVPRTDALFGALALEAGFQEVCNELDKRVYEKTTSFTWHHQLWEEFSHGYSVDYTVNNPTDPEARIVAYEITNDWDQGVWTIGPPPFEWLNGSDWIAWIKDNLYINDESLHFSVHRTPAKGYSITVKTWWLKK